MSPTRAKSRPRKAPPRPNGPSEIAPGVFVGGWNDALRFEGARFCVLDEAPDDMPTATHIPIYDDATDRAIVSHLDQLAYAVKTARSKGDPVLVFCGHGVRRSPLAGAWYLHRSEKLTLEQAYARIQKVRPKVERAQDWVGNPENLDDPH
ncbi:MAG: dual specificity protein phosphatase [Thermoplasmata archaeon]|jgi:protein-tyrosine phosphatase